MELLPTVKIQHPTIAGEYLLINESDFDPAIHTLWKEDSKRRSKKGGADDSQLGDDSQTEQQEPAQ